VTGFRIRADVVLHRAIDQGIMPPTARRIAAHAELSASTVARALRGEPVSASTLAVLTQLLGDGLAELIVDADPEILPFWRTSHVCATR
jgi:hypothetical protein